jgi:hypothetical protein
MAELGFIAAKGRNGTAELLKIIANDQDDRIPEAARFSGKVAGPVALENPAGIVASRAVCVRNGSFVANRPPAAANSRFVKIARTAC